MNAQCTVILCVYIDVTQTFTVAHDHCKDELELWKDENSFKSGADIKMKDVDLPESVMCGFIGCD